MARIISAVIGYFLRYFVIVDPAQKLLAAALFILTAALKPFWVKFSEGLADLAVEFLRYKLKRDRPELFRDTEIASRQKKEIASKHGSRSRKASRATSAKTAQEVSRPPPALTTPHHPRPSTPTLPEHVTLQLSPYTCSAGTYALC